MKKLTLANKKDYFKTLKPGDRFEYSFSTIALNEVRQLAKESGLNIQYLYGSTCEVTEYRNKYLFFAFRPNELISSWTAPMRNDADLLKAFIEYSNNGMHCSAVQL